MCNIKQGKNVFQLGKHPAPPPHNGAVPWGDDIIFYRLNTYILPNKASFAFISFLYNAYISSYLEFKMENMFYNALFQYYTTQNACFRTQFTGRRRPLARGWPDFFWKEISRRITLYHQIFEYLAC